MKRGDRVEIQVASDGTWDVGRYSGPSNHRKHEVVLENAWEDFTYYLESGDPDGDGSEAFCDSVFDVPLAKIRPLGTGAVADRAGHARESWQPGQIRRIQQTGPSRFEIVGTTKWFSTLARAEAYLNSKRTL